MPLGCLQKSTQFVNICHCFNFLLSIQLCCYNFVMKQQREREKMSSLVKIQQVVLRYDGYIAVGNVENVGVVSVSCVSQLVDGLQLERVVLSPHQHTVCFTIKVLFCYLSTTSFHSMVSSILWETRNTVTDAVNSQIVFV